MIPLSEIVIWFYENYPKFTYSKTAEIKFERMDLEMLVGMRILTMRYDLDFGTRLYRLRNSKRVPTTTRMIYSQRVQYAKDFYKNHKVAA